jgi:purine-nucleoside phosphorylase
LVDSIQVQAALPYADIPGFLPTSVLGHEGRLIIASWNSIPLVILQGRIHIYEGYTLEQVTFPTRVLCSMGIASLLLTNAAGGVRQDLRPGDLMMLTDHLNLSGTNPLLGPNDDRLGPRFPDLSQVYSPGLRLELERTAQALDITLHQGVYAWLLGPTYETPAEIRMLRILGADAVGMSTVPEAVIAAHMSIPVAAVSCISNAAASGNGTTLSHSQIAQTSSKEASRLSALLTHILPVASQYNSPGANF